MVEREARDGMTPPAAGADTVRWVDERVGASAGVNKALRYVFPDHWSFMLGEIALYAFVFLVLSGTYLALYFEPSTGQLRYDGSYAPLVGHPVSAAFRSALDLSLNVPAGLVLRQAHHWAALLFVAAIVLHLMRIFFTGAFRKPRDVNYFVGLTMLAFAILEGFMGYSLPDDLLSGMGLAIAYSVVMSIPIVGAKLAFLIWGGQFPGSPSFEPRIFIGHVFVLPVIIGTLIAVHLAIIMRQHHSDFRGPGRREGNVVGSPLWPGYALRSLGLFAAVAAALVLLGGLVQINPIWQWGPYDPWQGTNGAQPDWYLGWLIGALRLMPGFDVQAFGRTLVPNPFWGGVLFPTVVFAVLYAWPWAERRLTRDHRSHNLLDRPRDNPRRTALGAAFFAWVATIFIAGSGDRMLVRMRFPYESQIWFFRGMALVLPVVVFVVTLRICRSLKASEVHPLRGWTGTEVRRSAAGGWEEV
jgi:ubiquinol-cytochrome c reductase cytochrome b subunit